MTVDEIPTGKDPPEDGAISRGTTTGAHSALDALASARGRTGDSTPQNLTARSRRSHWRTAFALGLSACAIATGLMLFLGVHRSPVDATPAYLVTKPFKVAAATLPLDMPAASGGQPVPADGTGGCAPVLQPSSLIIPSVCVDGTIVGTTRQATGALLIPGDVHDVGLWDDGEPLLDPNGGVYTSGTTLVAGHVDFAGQGDGALFNLYRVQPGALVYATDASGRATLWRVVSAVSVLKADLPADVFAGTQGPRRLAIVTCGGDISYQSGEGWHYDDNVVVTAVPLGT